MWDKIAVAKAALGIWSACGLAWWGIAWRISSAAAREPVGQGGPGASPESRPPGPLPLLTIFKPLPRLGRGGLEDAEALASFIGQLDDESELLLGVHEADRAAVEPFLERMRSAHPEARVRPVFRAGPDGAANPKIAWQRLLAPEARGDLWLWSDADIAAPPGFLRQARLEFERARYDGVRMMTFPYVVREAASAPALFDALFINVEFHPGVLLLRWFGEVDFGLGAGMLFRRDDFYRETDWDRLGASLADDFVLGRSLQPVRIGAATLVATPHAPDWRAAFEHYLRWQKTICWCRPGGFAAQILILPVLGWLAAVLLFPGNPLAWAGLACLVSAEVFFADALCRAAGCRLRARDLPAVAGWSLLRGLVWGSCWLPWPVTWRQRRWWNARMVLAQPLKN